MADPYKPRAPFAPWDRRQLPGLFDVEETARRVGNYYSENEFYINRLQNLRTRMVEVGRSCIHRDHRSGGVITLLWAGLADYMVRNNYDYLIGCASIGMACLRKSTISLIRSSKAMVTSPGPSIRLTRPARSNTMAW